MALIASLPWYPFKVLESHYRTFWKYMYKELKSQGIDAPDTLNPAKYFRTHWRSPDLLLSQCCGYHIATKVQDLEVVAVPHFDLSGGVTPGKYRSVIIKCNDMPGDRIEDFRGMVAVYNDDQSYSGHTALLDAIPKSDRGQAFFSEAKSKGSHADAVETIVEGDAQVAAIDEVSYAIMRQNNPDLIKKTTIIKTCEAAQAPPYVTSRRSRSEEEKTILRNTLVRVSHMPEVKDALAAMRICSIIDAVDEDYLTLADKITKLERDTRFADERTGSYSLATNMYSGSKTNAGAE